MSKSGGYFCKLCGARHNDYPTVVVFFRLDGETFHDRGLTGTEKGTITRKLCRKCAREIAAKLYE